MLRPHGFLPRLVRSLPWDGGGLRWGFFLRANLANFIIASGIFDYRIIFSTIKSNILTLLIELWEARFTRFDQHIIQFFADGQQARSGGLLLFAPFRQGIGRHAENQSSIDIRAKRDNDFFR